MNVGELRAALAEYDDDERVLVANADLDELIGVDHVTEYFDGEGDLVYLVEKEG